MAHTKNGDALVTPNQNWGQNGSAMVDPLHALPYETRTLPLENRPKADYNIIRRQYTQGIVIIPTGNPPASTPATLPLFASGGAAYFADSGYFDDCPEGFIVWFL